LKKAKCTCTTAAPNMAKKTPLMLIACTNNFVRASDKRCKKETKHGAIIPLASVEAKMEQKEAHSS
jgi:hypothetical protein